MNPDCYTYIYFEVAKLGYVAPEQTEMVLEDFYQMCLANKAITEGGLEYARSVLQKAFGNQEAEQLLNKVTKALTNRSFSFLNKTDPKTLLSTLQHERAQTIALVLSHVDPDKAAAVLEELPPKKKLRVVEDIARMDSASPNAVKMIEDELQKKFSSIVVTENIQIGGLDHIAAIMNNLERSSEKAIFDGLEVKDSGLAEEIRKRMFVFEDIVHMDDRSVQRFIRDCDMRDIVLASRAPTRMWPTSCLPTCPPVCARISRKTSILRPMCVFVTWKRHSSASWALSANWRNAMKSLS